jgi:hypothetical protein
MSIPDSLSSAEFDDSVLRILTTNTSLPLTRGEFLRYFIDDTYGGEYSKKRKDYADVILASIARLQDRGLLSKYEGRTVLE